MTMDEVAFFFDLGGVLIENSGFHALRELSDFDGDDQEIRTRWLRSCAVSSYERGQLPTEQFARRVIEEFALPLSPDAFVAVFRSWVKGFYPGAQELVTRLRARYQVGCLSNCNELHWRSEWCDFFDFTLSSHLTGIVKPDAAAFSLMGEVSGLPLDRIIYFDDSMVNVEAARALGIQAHHANGFRDVEERISQDGWLKP